jgi:hypothetical protein
VSEVTAATTLARARVSRHVGILLALGVVAGVVGAVVVATLIGAQRTRTAMDRLVDASNYPAAQVRAFQPGPELDRIASLPEVAQRWDGVLPIGRVVDTADWFYPFAGYERPAGHLEPLLVAGRLPDPDRADEVLVTEGTARQEGYGVGDTVGIKVFTAEDFERLFDETTADPSGPDFELKVVGAVRDPADLSLGADKWFYGTPALAGATEDVSPARATYVWLRDDASADSFFEKAAAIANPTDGTVDIVDPRPELSRVADGPTRTLVAGLVGFAAIAAIAGATALAQLLGRALGRPLADQPTLVALGMTRRQRVGALVLPHVLSAAVAGLVTAVGAVALSPVFPIGALRIAEPDPGAEVHVTGLVLGAIGAGVATLLLAGLVAWFRTGLAASARERRPLRASVLVARLTHLGAEPAAVVGARMATEPGRGRTAVPVRATLVGVTATVVGLVAIATFQRSVERTTTVPARFGMPADYTVEVARDDVDAMVQDLEDWPEVTAVGIPLNTALLLDGTFTHGYAIEPRRGEFPPPLLGGRAPDRPDELAAGPRLIRQLDLEIGDRVTITALDGGTPLDFLLVGTTLTPTVQSDDYAGQVWMTADGLRRVSPDPEVMEVSLRYAPGTDRADVARRLDDAYPAGVTDESPPPVPAPLVTLRETDGLVRALGAFLTFLMLALTANALLAGVRNRAPDLAILRSLGFSSRQTNRSILWMSTTTVGLGLMVGIPLGLVLGGAVWRRVAGTLDIGSDMAAPWWFLAVLTVATLVAAAVLALIPGRRAARLRPVEVLRAE